jgi:hypothetical protein
LKRIVSLAVVGVLVGAVIAAGATKRPEHHPTTLTIEHVSVSPEGAILVTGTIDSNKRACEIGRVVVLRKAGERRFLDLAAPSYRGHAWALRSKEGVADGATIVVVAHRAPVGMFTIGPHGRFHFRHVCDAARLPVSYVE